MRNNNRAAVRRLSSRSLKNNRIRNLFAIFAIILTCMLFTAVFSMFSGMIQSTQEATMREVGGRFLRRITAVYNFDISKETPVSKHTGKLQEKATITLIPLDDDSESPF